MDELWRELGATMRVLRTSAGFSLRQVEVMTGRGRGLLSQIETGRSRPTRDLVEWYDETFHGDGLVVSMFAEARGAHGGTAVGRSPAIYAEDDDAFEIVSCTLPFGIRVEPGAEVSIGWVLRNAGTVPWRARELRRIGAVAAERLLRSPVSVRLEDVDPGHEINVSMDLTVPAVAGTFAAYWEVTDRRGGRCFDRSALLSAVVLADW